MQDKNTIQDITTLPLFNVFVGEDINAHTCKGNPAIVLLVTTLPTLAEHLCILKDIKISHQHRQTISPLSTLVYITPTASSDSFNIRWFSSTSSIKRCGHGTLAAAAFVERYILDHTAQANDNITLSFTSDSEVLNVYINKNIGNQQNCRTQYSLTLKTERLIKSDTTLPVSTGVAIVRENKTPDDDGYLIVELNDEAAINAFILTDTIIDHIKKRALIITAKAHGKPHDIVFRYFAPFYGEKEDSATGSAASLLMPFWQSNFFDSNTNAASSSQSLRCYQASPNGGFFTIQYAGPKNHLANNVDVVGTVSE